MDEFADARRDAMIASVLVAVIAGLLVLWTSGVLVVLGLVMVALGLLVSLTVIGAIVGIPLALVGMFGLIAGIVSGSAGIPFAILFGAGTGFVYYRFRLRALRRSMRRYEHLTR